MPPRPLCDVGDLPRDGRPCPSARRRPIRLDPRQLLHLLLPRRLPAISAVRLPDSPSNPQTTLVQSSLPRRGRVGDGVPRRRQPHPLSPAIHPVGRPRSPDSCSHSRSARTRLNSKRIHASFPPSPCPPVTPSPPRRPGRGPDGLPCFSCIRNADLGRFAVDRPLPSLIRPLGSAGRLPVKLAAGPQRNRAAAPPAVGRPNPAHPSINQIVFRQPFICVNL